MDIVSENINNFIRFIIIGVTNTLVNWIIFFILNNMNIHYIIATTAAYTVATMHSYIWNSRWVFKHSNTSIYRTIIKFVILNISGLLINIIILFVFIDIFNTNKFIALIMTTVIITLVNYIVNKFWIFIN